MPEQTFQVKCACGASVIAPVPKPCPFASHPEHQGFIWNIKENIVDCPRCGKTFMPVLMQIGQMQWNWVPIAENPNKAEKTIIIANGALIPKGMG